MTESKPRNNIDWKLDLAVVMPVYNESACIDAVVKSWLEVLSELPIDFQIIILNDGSRDDTGKVLDGLADDTRIIVIHKTNSGHGPTILKGYKIAVTKAPWVFQCDSDDEISAHEFLPFWHKRAQYDALIGVRTQREQKVSRSFISAVSRITIGFLCGYGVKDVNVPFRLIKSLLLAQAVEQIPKDTFAPNVIISGAIARSNAKIANLSVRHTNRRTGTASIVKWGLWQAAMRSFVQTLRCRPVIKTED